MSSAEPTPACFIIAASTPVLLVLYATPTGTCVSISFSTNSIAAPPPLTLSSDEKRVTESGGRGLEVFDPLHGSKFDF